MRFPLPAAFLLAASTLLLAEGPQRPEIPGWGVKIDHEGDCKFFVADSELLIAIPASPKPRDLAAEIGRTNAPRVLQPVHGDFVIQVKIEGRFTPGDQSTQEGRTGYNGAGLVLMADPQNVICLARAVLQRPGSEPMPYANFEMRSAGQVDQMGNANEKPLPKDGAVFLRLERRGRKVSGAVSLNGTDWDALQAKDLPAECPNDLQLGVVAITTSPDEFNPRFSKLQILK